jgi:multidrug efflux system membrane fusion protein
VQGKVRYIAPVANPATRTFNVELEIANRDGKLPVGVTAEISLPVGTVLAHRISPALLTLDDDGVVGVKILDDSGQVAFVPADVARSSADGVWITGLPDPARIITVGQGYVRPGQFAKAAPGPVPASAAAPPAMPSRKE